MSNKSCAFLTLQDSRRPWMASQNDPSIALGHFQPIRLKATNPLCTFIWRKRKKNIQCNKILILAPIPQVTKLTPDVLSRRKFCQLHPTLQKREPRSVKIYLAHYFCTFSLAPPPVSLCQTYQVCTDVLTNVKHSKNVALNCDQKDQDFDKVQNSNCRDEDIV